MTPQIEKSAQAKPRSSSPVTTRVRHWIGGYMGVLPDYVICGVQKGGTTSLRTYLQQHPQIVMTGLGEVHFFDAHYADGERWYRRHFPSMFTCAYHKYVRKAPLVIGESSPFYLAHPFAAKRAKQHIPDAKLIVLLRNPIDRAFSHYQHNRKAGRENGVSFEQALDRESERISVGRAQLFADGNLSDKNYRYYAYAERGIYVDQLMNWMQYFPRKQFLILKSEEFFADTARVMRKVQTFLRIPLWEQAAYPIHNKSIEGQMRPETRTRLAAFFRPHNQRLYDFLGVNYGWS